MSTARQMKLLTDEELDLAAKVLTHLSAIIEPFNFEGRHPIHHDGFGGCGLCDELPKLLPRLLAEIRLLRIAAEPARDASEPALK